MNSNVAGKKGPQGGKKNKNSPRVANQMRSVLNEIKQAQGRPRKRAVKRLGAEDLQISAPVASQSVIKNSGYRDVFNQREKSRHIVKRELIGSIAGSVAFTANKYACNPGLAATFPWLSTQAVGYEQYRFNKLKFEYVNRTTTATVGALLLAADYDPADATPTTEAQLGTYDEPVECAAWQNACFELNSKDMHPVGPRKFVRTSSVASDIKTYDAANFFIGSTDFAGSSVVGRLWVSYDVELFVPQTNPSAAVPSGTSAYAKLAAQTFTNATPAAMLWDSLVYDPIGIGAAASGVFTPPAGAYRVYVQSDFQDSSAETFTYKMELYKNGAALATPIKSLNQFPGTTLGGSVPVSLSLAGIIVCNGTDTFQIDATLTGAAGTLTSILNTQNLFINVA